MWCDKSLDYLYKSDEINMSYEVWGFPIFMHWAESIKSQLGWQVIWSRNAIMVDVIHRDKYFDRSQVCTAVIHNFNFIHFPHGLFAKTWVVLMQRPNCWWSALRWSVELLLDHKSRCHLQQKHRLRRAISVGKKGVHVVFFQPRSGPVVVGSHVHQKLTEKLTSKDLTWCHQVGGIYSISPGN